LVLKIPVSCGFHITELKFLHLMYPMIPIQGGNGELQGSLQVSLVSQ
jgi:hypothetical protein